MKLKTKKIKPYFLFHRPRKELLQLVKKKQAPDHFLYGLNYLVRDNLEDYFSDLGQGGFNFLHWLFLPLAKWLKNKTGVGFRLDLVLLSLIRLKNSQVIVAVSDSVGLSLAMLKYWRILKKPVVYLSLGLDKRIRKKENKKIIKLYSQFLSSVETVVCFSPAQKKMFVGLFKLDPQKIVLIPFGIDYQFFNRPRKKSSFILSVGKDRSRDYQLLFSLAKKLPKEKFVVVTSKRHLKNRSLPANVKVYFNLSYKKVRSLYLQAKLFILPLKEIGRPSGQVAFLEALACGLPTIAARTDSISFYGFQEQEHYWYYQPGSLKDLKQKTDFLLTKLDQADKRARKAKKIIKNKYTSQITGKRLLKEVEKLV